MHKEHLVAPAVSNYIIGLTGGIGSGKTAASDLFQTHGVVVVDADVVAREVVEPGSAALKEIARHFGKDILQDNGALDRAKLRQIIFSQPEQKTWLEQLLHPVIRDEIIGQLNMAQSPYVILSSPLLLETNQHQLCHRILLIDVPEACQIARASARDDNTAEQIKVIIASQAPRQFKLDNADDIIDNSNDISALKTQVDKYHQRYLDYSASHDRPNQKHYPPLG